MVCGMRCRHDVAKTMEELAVAGLKVFSFLSVRDGTISQPTRSQSKKPELGVSSTVASTVRLTFIFRENGSAVCQVMRGVGVGAMRGG